MRAGLGAAVRRAVGSDSVSPRPSQPDAVTAEDSGEDTVLPAAGCLAFPERESPPRTSVMTA